jgi:hypothetical protein
MKPESVWQLPVVGMKGEGLTSVWDVTMKKRDKKNEEVQVAILDAVSLTMARDEICVVLDIKGYAHAEEPQ